MILLSSLFVVETNIGNNGSTNPINFNFLPVLSIILKSKSPFELMNKPNMKDAIEALIPYSGEINFVHNKRDTELIVSSSMTVC